MDQDASTLLISLDISAAFDIMDHNILLNKLNTGFGITATALASSRS